MPGPEELASRVRAWLDEHPEHPDLLRLAAADTLRREPGSPRAFELLERLARACPVDDLPHRELARALLDTPDDAAHTRAIEHLVFLDDREEYTPVYAERLALLLAERGRWPEAMVRAERATRVDPFNPRLRELAARITIAAGDLEAAERHVVALAELEPDRPEPARRLDALRARRAQPGP
jgi:predicted Zn-dependent protease